jgi:glycosyltransferase involved in cell wall biosynthesis
VTTSRSQTLPERSLPVPSPTSSATGRAPLQLGLLTAGRDKPYALGLGPALADEGILVDFIGSDMVDGPELRNHPRIRFLNLRNQAEDASLWTKMTRVVFYYARLMTYAARFRGRLLHILWNNKFEYFDRTLLMVYYRLVGKRLIFTVHNVNAGQRDGNDSWLNRRTLQFQYHRCEHLFVHTRRMKAELCRQFGVREERVTVIPFGINNTLPNTSLTREAARQELDLPGEDPVLLFFGNIAPYKGVHVLIEALRIATPLHPRLRLIIAGRPKGEEEYWRSVKSQLVAAGVKDRVAEHITYIPDERVEVFCKAADALVLPYTHVFQSGVLFLGYSFGLPVIATDVGSLREEVIEGRTGWICRPDDASDLARTIERWLESDLYRNRGEHRTAIREHANQRYSWTTVGKITKRVYDEVLGEATSDK